MAPIYFLLSASFLLFLSVGQTSNSAWPLDTQHSQGSTRHPRQQLQDMHRNLRQVVAYYSTDAIDRRRRCTNRRVMRRSEGRVDGGWSAGTCECQLVEIRGEHSKKERRDGLDFLTATPLWL